MEQTFFAEEQDSDNAEGTQAQSNSENIKNFGSSSIQNSKGNIHCLTIVGQVEGHMILPPQNKTTKYEHVIPLLVSVEEDESVDGLIVILNTVGGDVEAGLAIAEMLASMEKPVVSLVLGGGHSIGVPLAVASKHSFIAPSATMTIHPVRLNGLVIGVPQTYYYFERMQDRIVKFVTKHSGITEEKFREYLLATDQIATDTGSLIDGIEAVSSGLIDEAGGLADALAYLRGEIAERKKKS